MKHAGLAGLPRSIAVAQTIPARGDVDANIDEHMRLARFAAEVSARVLVFPELSLTGYELDLAPKLAFEERDERLDPLIERARAHDITLIVGAPARIGARLHIAAFVISPDEPVVVYTKHRLGAFSSDDSPDGVVPPPEATVFDPGDLDPSVPVGAGVAAIAVCADVASPAHARAARSRGATTYLASMFVIPSDLEKDTATLRSLALKHHMAVAFANYGGPSGGLRSGGSSFIWSEAGDLLARLPAEGSGVAVALETSEGWQAEMRSDD